MATVNSTRATPADLLRVEGKAELIGGKVVQGHQRGRTIGVPTANLAIVDQLIPADGVYAGRCAIGRR